MNNNQTREIRYINNYKMSFCYYKIDNITKNGNELYYKKPIILDMHRGFFTLPPHSVERKGYLFVLLNSVQK